MPLIDAKVPKKRNNCRLDNIDIFICQNFNVRSNVSNV